MFKQKEITPMTVRRHKETIEKAKTITLVAIFALGVGIAIGFKAGDTLQSKYSRLNSVQAVNAAPVADQSK